MQQQLSDIDIIQQVLNGRKNAFSILVGRYQNYVFTLIIRMGLSREEAEELAQDVFVKAFRSLADFQGKSKFSTWLYTITHTTCLSHFRKKQLDTRSFDELPPAVFDDRQFTEDSNTIFEKKSRHAIITHALKMLSPSDAEMIQLFYLAEQSLEEIGTITGISAATAKVKLHRARTRLRTVLEKHFQQEISFLKSS